MNIYLAKARGFCMGVERSISMAKDAREKLTGEITILNEIVHNNSVVADLDNMGINRTRDLDKVNSGTLIISAHGVAPSVVQSAKDKELNIIDSTCPLVTVLHKAADFFIKKGYTVIVFGDPDHDEMKGVKGHNPDRIIILERIASLEDLPDIDGNVALISQSTQSMELFEKATELVGQKYGEVKIKNTICSATRKHQTAVVDLAARTDLMIVVGSQTSANSQRLAQISKRLGTPAYLIDDYSEIDPLWLKGIKNVGITAGASTPDWAIGRVVDRIKELALSDGNAEVNVFDERSNEFIKNEE